MSDSEAQLARKSGRSHISDTGMSWMLIFFVLILTAVAVSVFEKRAQNENVATGSETPAPTQESQSRTYTVSYKGGVFSPTNLRIHSGDTVRFRNDGILTIHVISDPHPTHSGLLGFDSVGDVPSGGAFSYTFTVKGTFGYHNERYPDETGTIIVR